MKKCNHCGSEITKKSGIHNWKNLFKKPTLEDLITLFIILMVIVSAYAYRADIKNLREYYEDDQYCMQENMVKETPNLETNFLQIPNVPGINEEEQEGSGRD